MGGRNTQMSAPNFKSEADKAGSYPQFRFGQRERKLLESIQDSFPFAVIAAGEFTTAGGDANEAIAVSGALASDISIVTLNTPGSTPRTVSSSNMAAGQINVVMSGDPSTDHVLNYIVLRSRA